MSGFDSSQRRGVVFLDRTPRNSVRIFPRENPATSNNAVNCGLRSVPELSYPLGTGGAITTTFCSDVCRALRNQCADNNTHGREVGGILVGYHRQSSKLFHKHYQLIVTDIVPVESRDSSSTHVVFGRDAWSIIESEIRRTYVPQGKGRLGWYHTHPVQGIFFSPEDRQAHAVFKQPFELALVVDPKSMEAGLYYWRDYRDRTLAGPLRFLLPA